MAIYAIVQASGKQVWVEENRFYDLNKLPLAPGDKFKLNRILLVNKHGNLQIGKPFLDDNWRIEATVIRHLSSSKVLVYKMRSKKKTRKKFGSRAKLTRVLINSIEVGKEAKVVCYL